MLTQLKTEESVVGKSETRIDSIEKVTGRAAYCFDLGLPNMLYGVVKRSLYDHAKIIRVDHSRAKRLPGVRTIITSEDLPDLRAGTVIKDTPVLARGVVRYVGEPIAAVAATDMRTAIVAAEMIEVEYERLPAIQDPELSASEHPDVILHSDFPKYERVKSGSYFASPHPMRPNVNNWVTQDTGDVDSAFKGADLVVETRFETGMIQHFPMEPMVILAKPEPDGLMTVWITGQNAHRAKHEISDGLGLDENFLRVIVPKYVGGGFGNRYGSSGGAIAVALAMKTQKPIKLSFSRYETLAATTVRHPSVFVVKDGVKKNGKIIARYVRAIYDGGAYAFEGHNVVKNCCVATTCVYNIRNFRLEAFRVYTNKQPGGAYRGYAGPQAIWAIERQMDILSEKLRLDPLELRRLNFLKEGELTAANDLVENFVVNECLKSVSTEIRWNSPKPEEADEWRTGKGIAVAAKWSWPNYPNAAYIKVLEDGSLVLYSSVIDVGQGTPTSLAQLVAGEFGVPLSKVKLMEADSSTTPLNVGAAGSRQLYNLGNAVLRASRDAKRKIFERAALILNEPPERLSIENGIIFVAGNEEKKLPIKRLFKDNPGGGMYIDGEGELIGRGFFEQREGYLDPRTGKAVGGRATAYYTSTAQAAEVAVNVKTGEVKVLRMVAAVNVGKAINPRLVEGQIEGGVVMAVGPTLYEEAVIGEEGGFANTDLKDYKLPTSIDVPPVKAIILEYPSKYGPFGAEGCGEASLLATAPAIGNAIADAIGIQFTRIPITREAVLGATKGIPMSEKVFSPQVTIPKE